VRGLTGSEVGGAGPGEEMTQTMYAHVNKLIIEKEHCFTVNKQ
jgi:hypothetical protein